MRKTTRAHLLLALTALIWGVAFVAQDVAADTLEPFTINAARMGLAALALLPALRLKRPPAQASAGKRGTLLLGGFLCGVMLALGSAFQQLGIDQGTGAGKAGFITALYIVLVPVAGLFMGKKPRALVWVAVCLSAVGLYLLCVRDGFTLSRGDGLLLVCALSFTGHILVVDHFSRRVDCLKMSFIQFAVTSALCALVAAFTETPSLTAIAACWLPVLYAGVLSGGVGYTLQIIGQRDSDPTVASLILSLESLFAVLAGWLLLGDALTPKECLGCVLMMGGILLSQLPGQGVEVRKCRSRSHEG